MYRRRRAPNPQGLIAGFVWNAIAIGVANTPTRVKLDFCIDFGSVDGLINKASYSARSYPMCLYEKFPAADKSWLGNRPQTFFTMFILQCARGRSEMGEGYRK